MAKEKATIAATLGHEYEDLEEREDFLANNADSVEKWSSSNDSTLMS